jgi:hypothetical protein
VPLAQGQPLVESTISATASLSESTGAGLDLPLYACRDVEAN